VVAELELNSVSPPPDTVEEEIKKTSPISQLLKGEPSHVKANSKRELSKTKHLAKDLKAVYSSVHYKTINLVHDVDSKVVESNPLLNDRLRPARDTGTCKTAQTSLLEWLLSKD